MSGLPTLAVTAGEPAGVGPDLVLRLPAQALPARCVVVADRELLAERAARLGLAVTLADYDPARPPAPGALEVLHVPLAAPCTPGVLDAANAGYVLETLDVAIDGCMAGEFGAMVTAPLHKGVINDAGTPFTGHTEYLAERTATPRVVMMLVGGGMRVALATTHLPLRDVADAITFDGLIQTLTIVHDELRRKFRIAAPHILVAGLNPHAGEGGHLGREEITVITPVLELLRGQGMDLVGPLPADTLFQPDKLAACDAVLAMYHDQGLPVLKHASFGHGVNITLGLPIVRTSVDHGTALDLAGSGRADAGSLLEAVRLAAQLAG